MSKNTSLIIAIYAMPHKSQRVQCTRCTMKKMSADAPNELHDIAHDLIARANADPTSDIHKTLEWQMFVILATRWLLEIGGVKDVTRERARDILEHYLRDHTADVDVELA